MGSCFNGDCDDSVEDDDDIDAIKVNSFILIIIILGHGDYFMGIQTMWCRGCPGVDLCYLD